MIRRWDEKRSYTWSFMVFSGAASMVRFQIKGWFRAIGKLSIESKNLTTVMGRRRTTTFVLEHCTKKRSFHSIEVVYVFFICPKRRGFTFWYLHHRRIHSCGRMNGFVLKEISRNEAKICWNLEEVVIFMFYFFWRRRGSDF